MKYFTHKNKKYKVDSQGFLMNPNDWDENFAKGMAPKVKITNGLTKQHWKIIYFIRNTFEKMNVCPLVYVACKKNNLGLGDLKRLFPTGYQRGACKLSGITYREGYFQYYWLEKNIKRHEYYYNKKIYQIDAQGFLLDPLDWDENFAINKAFETKMPEYLTEEHWKIIYYLREKYKKTKNVPTVYRTCKENQITLEKLEKLFPDGYHRGAIKIAGLKLR